MLDTTFEKFLIKNSISNIDFSNFAFNFFIVNFKQFGAFPDPNARNFFNKNCRCFSSIKMCQLWLKNYYLEKGDFILVTQNTEIFFLNGVGSLKTSHHQNRSLSV